MVNCLLGLCHSPQENLGVCLFVIEQCTVSNRQFHKDPTKTMMIFVFFQVPYTCCRLSDANITGPVPSDFTTCRSEAWNNMTFGSNELWPQVCVTDSATNMSYSPLLASVKLFVCRSQTPLFL